MDFKLYITLIFAGLILWIYGFSIVFNKKKLVRYTTVNTLVFVLYLVLWINYSKVITGQDEYDLAFLFGLPLILVIHSIIVFLIIVLTLRRIKNE